MEGSFVRGGHYRWHTSGNFALSATDVHGDTGEEPFKVGMGPGKPLEPADGATVPAGNVVLRWRTADAPGQLVPPLEVIQAHAANTAPEDYVFFDGHIQEHWDLEVHKGSADGAVIFNSDGEVGYQIFLSNLIGNTSAITAAEEALYKELTATVPISEEGTYYWQLKWRKDPEDITAGYYHQSDVFSFKVGSGGATTTPAGTPTEEPTAEEACVANCNADLPTDVSPGIGGVHVNDVLDMGKFKLVVKTVSISAPYTGTGTIEIPFLNHLKMQVDFEGIRANSALEVYAGSAKAKRDHLTGTIAKVQSSIGYIPGLSAAEKTELSAALEDSHRLVSGLVASAEIGLPIGIDREVGGRQVVLGIVNMEFAPTRAFPRHSGQCGPSGIEHIHLSGPWRCVHWS
ncbi:MAG: hypothetical protein IPG11_15920 [Flavobacteriales bacterium]|nr:hypothetical protein [Flavobacteriales bacterium]